MIDFEARYRRLRAAVQAYDHALRAYGLLGTAWVEHSETLEQLYAELLKAADLDGQPVQDKP
jgi:hypothetical protein